MTSRIDYLWTVIYLHIFIYMLIVQSHSSLSVLSAYSFYTKYGAALTSEMIQE